MKTDKLLPPVVSPRQQSWLTAVQTPPAAPPAPHAANTTSSSLFLGGGLPQMLLPQIFPPVIAHVQKAVDANGANGRKAGAGASHDPVSRQEKEKCRQKLVDNAKTVAGQKPPNKTYSRYVLHICARALSLSLALSLLHKNICMNIISAL